MTDQQYLNIALRIIVTRPWAFWIKFDDWLIDNLDIQRAFDAQALAVVAQGREHYSAYTIVEYLRHDTFLRQVQAHSMLKINNNLTASMARLFGCMYPQHKGLFEYRS